VGRGKICAFEERNGRCRRGLRIGWVVVEESPLKEDYSG
jgi:hypothetical protein